jgi:alkanesulfonate monooxygenase SsuD/methylene tetrahydromethanopterin reductase-like flavin-dependent oxidoreductase (luciferase family)
MNLDGQHPERGSLDAWGTLCALAAVTERLRLGTLVSPATFRHPANLAKLVATADRISDGRVELGLGAGWHEREHRAYGFPFPPTGERMNVLEEQLEVVFRSWSANESSFEGRHYALERLDAQPKPVQQPHPPLIMGGNAGPRSARLAARFADEYNTPFPTLEQVRERRTRIAEACTRADREPIPFSVMTCVIVGASDDDVRERVRRVAEKIGADGKALFSDPPEPWVLGTVDQVAERFRALGEAGVSRVMCQHLLHEDAGAVALLAEVAARLR